MSHSERKKRIETVKSDECEWVPYLASDDWASFLEYLEKVVVCFIDGQVSNEDACFLLELSK